MNKEEFAKIARKIENAYRDPFTKDQASDWFQQFKGEDFSVVDRACDRLVGEYKYFPVPATLRQYIESVKKDNREQAEKLELEKTKRPEPTQQDKESGKRWVRFTQWFMENKKYPKTDDEAEKMKADFEKNYPDWQPKKRGKKESTNPEPVKDVLEDVFGEL